MMSYSCQVIFMLSYLFTRATVIAIITPHAIFKCAILRLRSMAAQSRDRATIVRNLEIGTQSRDSENAQRNLEIAQILKLPGTYIHVSCLLVVILLFYIISKNTKKKIQKKIICDTVTKNLQGEITTACKPMCFQGQILGSTATQSSAWYQVLQHACALNLCPMNFRKMAAAVFTPHTCTSGRVIGRVRLLSSLLSVSTKKKCQFSLSVLFARYSLQALKIPLFELASWACLLTTPRYLATC